MRYLPHTPEDIAAMLEAIGVKSLEDLFPTVPNDCRRTDEMEFFTFQPWPRGWALHWGGPLLPHLPSAAGRLSP